MYDVLSVYYYNFAWKDYGEATLEGLLNMVKVLAFALSEGRVAIHCHAGKLIIPRGLILVNIGVICS